VRENRAGKVAYTAYGKVSSVALDPIEKKPLRLFHPGKRILSVGGVGCNLRCPFCQNFELSAEFGHRRTKTLSPEQVAALAVEAVPDGNIGVAYTYNEPLIGVEFVLDCAKLIRGAGLCNVLVTNGMINKGPLEELLPLIDAMNIDLKGFTGDFYRGLGGDLETVKQTITLSRGRCHVEVTTLVIPGENEDDIEPLSAWLASLDPEIPLHLSRFFPRYRYADRQPTPVETLFRLRDVAGRFLKNVFVGNV
jgi:pyruvate formate lyase activating enzyme